MNRDYVQADDYYDGLEDYKFGVARQKKLDERDTMTTKPNWGGFSRQFTRMADRDPNPYIPFVDVGPVLTRKEVAVSVAIGMVAVALFAAYIIVGVFK